MQHDWSKRLVGHVTEEYLISPEVMMKWKKAFFDPIIGSYGNAHYKEEKIDRILILSHENAKIEALMTNDNIDWSPIQVK